MESFGASAERQCLERIGPRRTALDKDFRARGRWKQDHLFGNHPIMPVPIGCNFIKCMAFKHQPVISVRAYVSEAPELSFSWLDLDNGIDETAYRVVGRIQRRQVRWNNSILYLDVFEKQN